jgi:hypothetical protein
MPKDMLAWRQAEIQAGRDRKRIESFSGGLKREDVQFHPERGSLLLTPTKSTCKHLRAVRSCGQIL